ncbi:hypothetical protein A7K91_10530 [Paenibacillus oryzae]|uniref:Uncharacterized protein n=1 Tax=Paenibacillus oryzae TaxID=1844972 RepID=A0A1A5YRJ4_9BACL|nr:hypothetical protein [Paenibacillus oryzae]OBR68241.1 hypothetical protein A7K91_10530 [Paenibacillus oryzae]
MNNFQAKIDILKGIEATAYTVCLKLLADEGAACRAAQSALIGIFRDPAFWNADEPQRNRFVLRHCFSVCSSQCKKSAV